LQGAHAAAPPFRPREIRGGHLKKRFVIPLCAIWLAAAAVATGQETPTPTPTPRPEPQTTPPPEPAAPTPVPVAPSAGAVNATFFNPAIAVIGNFLANVGHNPVQPSPAFQVEESEISFLAVVDPYARADLFLSFSNDGVEVEEGYVTFLTLPWQTQAKAGKFKVQFGKVNTLHLHVLPWVDEPLPITDILLQTQFETWTGEGISISKVIELPGETFSEAYFQVLDGTSDPLFVAPAKGDLTYNGQYRIFRDFGDDHNVEASFSYAYGHNGTSATDTTSLQNAALVYRWKPLQGSPYRSFILRSEYFWSQREQPDGKQSAQGFFVGGDWQLGRRWFTGARYEFSDRAVNASLRDKGVAATLTFKPSEFSMLRAQYRYREYAPGIKANEGFLQIQFAIGAHGAHPF
jgi:hypothetical protein